MSTQGNPVVEDEEKLVTTGREGKQKINEGQKYSKDLRSRFGEAFLPFASRLESVEKKRTLRKRKGKNKKNQPTRITKVPMYQKKTRKLEGATLINNARET